MKATFSPLVSFQLPVADTLPQVAMTLKYIAVSGVLLACSAVVIMQYFGLNFSQVVMNFTDLDLLKGLAQRYTSPSNDFMLKKDELAGYKFKYLAIVGEVFDVRSGEKHYGKEGSYNFFTGELQEYLFILQPLITQ